MGDTNIEYTISKGDLYNILKYVNMEEGVEIVCPELFENDKTVQCLCEKLKWARRGLKRYLEDKVDLDDEV